MTEPRRASRSKRFAVSLLSAAAAFVIVFEFLALQLQGAGSPAAAGVAGPPQSASMRAVAGTPITSRVSGAAATASAPSATVSHARHFHPVATRASGGVTRTHTESDDL